MSRVRASFDFRSPQEHTDDGLHQYEFQGFVDIDIEKNSLIITVDNEEGYVYSIMCKLSTYNNYVGESVLDDVKMNINRLTPQRFCGVWFEEGIEYLLLIKLKD